MAGIDQASGNRTVVGAAVDGANPSSQEQAWRQQGICGARMKWSYHPKAVVASGFLSWDVLF